MKRVDVLYAYIEGFKCGASISAFEKKFSESKNTIIVEEYSRGYGDGRRSIKEHQAKAESRLGVKFKSFRGATGQQ